MIRIPITESSFPDGEEADEIIVFPYGDGRWGAIYAEEEINGAQDGEGDCPLLAAADLVLAPWREA